MSDTNEGAAPQPLGPSATCGGRPQGDARANDVTATITLPVHVHLVRREATAEDLAGASPGALADWTGRSRPWETCEVEARAGRALARCSDSFPAGLMDEETRKWFEGHVVAVALDRLRGRIAKLIKR